MKRNFLRRKKRPLILDSEKNVPKWMQISDRLLTVLLWLAYLYLVRDGAFFIGGVLRWLVLDKTPPDFTEFFENLRMAGIYLLIIFTNGLVYIGWARYNYLRFHGVERRKFMPPISTETRAAFFEIPPQLLAAWEQEALITMRHNTEGKLILGEWAS